MKNLKKISRQNLKNLTGGNQQQLGACYINRQWVLGYPCDGLCPNGTQPVCADL